MATFGNFADLSRYEKAQALAAAEAAQPVNSLQAAIQGYQQAQAIQRMPQVQAQQALSEQLALQLQQAKLAQLQQPEIFNAGGNLLVRDPSSPTGVRSIFSSSAPIRNEVIQTPIGLFERDSTGKLVNVAPFAAKAEKKEVIETPVGILERDDSGKLVNTFPFPAKETIVKPERIRTFDAKSGLYGVHELNAGETLPEGIVPESQAPKPKQAKPLPSVQVDHFAAYGVLEKKIGDIEKTPEKVRASNVGWLDSTLGYIQGVTGAGKKDTLKLNDSFRSAVDSLVGEFSFGRGGKSLTIGEKETLAKYLPGLTLGNATFESRLSSFKSLVKELRESRIQALEDSGYDVTKLQERIKERELSLDTDSPSSSQGTAQPSSGAYKPLPGGGSYQRLD